MKANDVPDCFGSQAESLLHGEAASECLDCELFDKCHKITVAACLQSVADGVDLIVQNGLVNGRLKGFEELQELAEAESGKET